MTHAGDLVDESEFPRRPIDLDWSRASETRTIDLIRRYHRAMREPDQAISLADEMWNGLGKEQTEYARLHSMYGGRSALKSIIDALITADAEIPKRILDFPSAHGRVRTGMGVGGSLGGSLVQALPVDSLGLSSLSIYVSTKPEAGGELLRIRLRAIETDQRFGEWLLGAAAVRPGWVELALKRAIDEPALSLEVSVEWPSTKSGWALALGAPHPYRDLCAHTEAGEALGGPLAMRLFSSLPGVRVTATTNAIKSTDALQALAEFIPYEVYGTVAQVVPALRDNKPTLVFYDRNIGCLTVHPRTGGLTLAHLDVVVRNNAWAVSAQIHLAHERASATGFALMVCSPGDESRELARLGQLDAPSLSFSGWKTLSPLETRSITLVLAESAAGRQLALYLVTRQAPDASSDFAWARFSKLEFNVLPRSLAAENEPERLIPSAPGLVHAGAE